MTDSTDSRAAAPSASEPAEDVINQRLREIERSLNRWEPPSSPTSCPVTDADVRWLIAALRAARKDEERMHHIADELDGGTRDIRSGFDPDGEVIGIVDFRDFLDEVIRRNDVHFWGGRQ